MELKKIDPKITGLIIGGILVLLLIISIIAWKIFPNRNASPRLLNNQNTVPSLAGETPQNDNNTVAQDRIAKFSSVDDFKNYLEQAEKSGGAPFFGFGRGGGIETDLAVPQAKTFQGESGAVNSEMAPAAAPVPGRISNTNVQVLGIDEPDVVKTDGQQIYFSPEENFYRPLMMEKRASGANSAISSEIAPPFRPDNPERTGVKVIKAFPPEELKINAQIDKNGDLFIYKDTLVVFSRLDNKIYGYDISKPEEPKQKWDVAIKDKDELAGARLYQGQIYLATRSFIAPDHPCPIEPFVVGSSPVKFECSQIYHPDQVVPVDLTYNLLALNAATGEVLKTASFVGSSSSSVLYMSGQAVYLAYDYPGNFVKLFADFLGVNSDVVPSSISDKIKKIEGYDLSDTAKLAELEDILGHFTRSLSSDEMMRIQNELSNRVDKFYHEHGRKLTNTGIVKVSIPQLDVSAMGKVPGQLLNQYSLDEYKGNLRVATTSNSNFGWIGGIISGNSASSISDVFVLDKDLSLTGQVTDLGKGERIYSVRFIGNSGYVVTFKQADPFYVLDLSDASHPQLKGELKIPGYSSYLHPIDNQTILGIGQENGQVKLTLFDIRTPSDPQELNTYKLNENYSEAQNDPHAFLQDAQNKRFFIPGSQGGYVFSYQDNQLKLAKVISEPGAKRGVYIDHYFYLIANNKIAVFDENNWEKIKDLEF
jgi:inhibitor of cysteine peptidase